MKDRKTLLKELTAKDERAAAEAAEYLINEADTELFKMLADKSDFLFPFVRENVSKRIEKAVNKSNFTNLIKFFDYYSPYYDDLFALILAKHADEDLTDRIIELLEKGTDSEKTYAAKYFVYIPDTAALEILSRYVFSDDENLSANAAEALGGMRDDVSYDIALENLEAGDGFDKLKAVKFFTAYGRNFPYKEVFDAMETSNMPENIAGQIPYAASLLNLLNSEYKKYALSVIYYIISGLGEILPVSEIFQFELYEVLETLINVKEFGEKFPERVSLILLNALSKFKMFSENEEYIFDEDKDTKQEITSILNLLQKQNDDFWNAQKDAVIRNLKGGDEIIAKSLPVITDYKIKAALSEIKKLLNSSNEIIIYEALNSLKQQNALEKTDIETALSQIKNPNIKALIETM